jgi:hypothetical protein
MCLALSSTSRLTPERVRTPAKFDHKGERFFEAHKLASRGALDQSHTARQTRLGPPQDLRKNLRTSPRLTSG